MSGGRVHSGGMRHRIMLQNPVVTVGDFGSDVVAYTDATEVWAKIKSLGSVERVIADQYVAVAKYEIMIRHLDGVTEQTRVKLGTDIFNIEAINKPDFVDKQLILTVVQDRSKRGDGSIE